MPSFDVVSEVDQHELTNAVDQANRELSTRFDFKGVAADFSLEDSAIVMTAPSEFQLQQMQPILHARLTARKIDTSCLDWQPITSNLSQARQSGDIKQGIDSDTAKKLVKQIKASKIKVQAVIQENKIRVTGKKRDDLQQVMTLLRDTDAGLPLQFNNFRD